MITNCPDPGTRRGGEVRRMFSSIAPRYDLLNHLLSLNIDRCWRKKAAKALAPEPGKLYLDLCCGTGDFALELMKREGVNVVGVDFSAGMLKIAEKKRNGRSGLKLSAGDALSLPFKDGSFDGGTVAFGIRNFEKLEEGMSEIRRVMKKDAGFVVLEFPHKVGGIFGPLFNFYFRKILPLIGRLISKDSFAYTYLPESVGHFPADYELKELFARCGFEVVSFRKRTFGIVFEALLKKR